MYTGTMRWLGLVALLGACNTSSHLEGGLSAGEAARAVGIDAYVIRDGKVEIYGADSTLFGVLTVAAPTVDTRLVRVEHGALSPYENEVTRPLADGSFRAPVGLGADEQVLADAALSSFFAGYKLRFETVDPSLQEPIAALDPETLIAACNDIPFAAGCTAYTTCENASGGGTLPANHTLFGYASQSACETACNNTFPPVGTTFGVLEGSDCKCYTQYTSNLDRKANCPASSCSASHQLDIVQKTRTCLNPGSCSNTAQGWTGACYNIDTCAPSYCPSGGNLYFFSSSSALSSYSRHGGTSTASNGGSCWTPSTFVYSVCGTNAASNYCSGSTTIDGKTVFTSCN